MKRIHSLLITFLILQSFSTFASNDFETWKKGCIKRASKRGIPSYFTRKHLENVMFNKEIILKHKNQITSNAHIDYHKWIKGWLRDDNSRITIAREMLVKHKDLLKEVERKYHVDKEVIISLWGVETFFGKIVGDYDIISSLTSLSYKSRRKKFFETQLFAAFRLLYQGHTKRENLKGSWAGATGQMQFMPSNFNGFAKDFDGDHKKDIWKNHADIFASIAYYLKKRGWKRNQIIGTFVKKTRLGEFDYNKARSSKKYNELGIRTLDEQKLKGKWKRKLATIPFKHSPLILQGPNYRPIMGWNNSSLFAALNIIIIDSLSK